jgi:phosphoglycerate dehydrogenase-like enzyme
MLSLLLSVHLSNLQLQQGQCQRLLGRRLEDVTVGIIGVGRIGSLVLRKIQGFGTSKFLVNDILPNNGLNNEIKLMWVSKEIIYKEAYIVSLN